VSKETDILERGRQVITPTYAAPIAAHRGESSVVVSVDGKKYLDFAGGIGVHAVGHSHPEVLQAIFEQSVRLCHTANGTLHEPYVHLCEELVRLSFGDKVFLTNSGTEAMEAALKLARRYHAKRGAARHVTVATHGSFHGRSLGALSITGQAAYRDGYEPLLPETRFVLFGDAEAAWEAITQDDKVGAVVVEPIQGNAGVVPAPPGYLQTLRDACDQSGALLIFDEIQTGLCRTGTFFAHQHDGIKPDIMTLAKALGGGLPLGAMVARADIADALSLGSHGSTFGGNPVACAAGLAVLKILERDGLAERATQKGERVIEALRDVQAQTSGITDVRGRGLMIGIELAVPATDARKRCLDAGLLVTAAGTHTIRLLPPLNTSEEQIDQAIAILSACLPDQPQ